MPSAPSSDILRCPRCGGRDTRSARMAKALGTSVTRTVSRSISQAAGLIFGGRVGGGGWTSSDESASISETQSGLAEMLALPPPPSEADVRRSIVRRLRQLRGTGDWRSEIECFRRFHGLVFIDQAAVDARAAAEYQRRLRLHELFRKNWSRIMVCLRCGEIYDPYLHDEILAEGRRLYESGERATGSPAIDATLTRYEEQVEDAEGRAERGELVAGLEDLPKRLQVEFGGQELHRAVRDGRLSPVAVTRMLRIACRAAHSQMHGMATRYRDWIGTVTSAVERSGLSASAQAPLLIKVDTAAATVEGAVSRVRDAIDGSALSGDVPMDTDAFSRAGRLLEEVVMVGQVAAAYRSITGADSQRHHVRR